MIQLLFGIFYLIFDVNFQRNMTYDVHLFSRCCAFVNARFWLMIEAVIDQEIVGHISMHFQKEIGHYKTTIIINIGDRACHGCGYLALIRGRD